MEEAVIKIIVKDERLNDLMMNIPSYMSFLKFDKEDGMPLFKINNMNSLGKFSFFNQQDNKNKIKEICEKHEASFSEVYRNNIGSNTKYATFLRCINTFAETVFKPGKLYKELYRISEHNQENRFSLKTETGIVYNNIPLNGGIWKFQEETNIYELNDFKIGQKVKISHYGYKNIHHSFMEKIVTIKELSFVINSDESDHIMHMFKMDEVLVGDNGKRIIDEWHQLDAVEPLYQ